MGGTVDSIVSGRRASAACHEIKRGGSPSSVQQLCPRRLCVVKEASPREDPFLCHKHSRLEEPASASLCVPVSSRYNTWQRMCLSTRASRVSVHDLAEARGVAAHPHIYPHGLDRLPLPVSSLLPAAYCQWR